MSKKLFLVTAFMVAFSASAQVLESDNFNSYTTGNVSDGVSTTSYVYGQGGMYIVSGAVSDYQIIAATGADAAHGNYLQVTGGNDATASSSRYVLKNGLGAAWTARTAGNDIIKESVDIFTGSSTNQHLSGVAILNSNVDVITGIFYDSKTKLFKAYINLTKTSDSTQSSYVIPFSSTTNAYPANTWVNVEYTYNKTTGATTFKIGGITYQATTYPGYTGTIGLDPVYHSVQNVFESSSTNSGPTTFGIDNYIIEATNNATLGTSETKNTKASIIAIVPNPATDDLNILTGLKINKAEIFDMSGRKMNVHLEGNKMDVKSLNSGSYIINIETKEGKTTEKFIKK